MVEGVGAAPDIIYAQGVPIDPSPDPASFDRKDCSLILFETDFCRDLGCQDKLTKKTEKYYSLLCALQIYWGRDDLVYIPIGHACTTLHDTEIATTLANQGPPLHRHQKRKKNQDTRNKQDGPHPRQSSCKDPP